MQISSLLFRAILLFFVGTCGNPIMADDAIMFSNPFIMPMQDEELEETFFDVNVFQWPCEEEPIGGVVRT
jgi:hypothetical protein